MAETLESAVQPFLNLVELLQLEELTTPEIAARLNVTVPEFQAMYQAARAASQSILDPGKNYIVLDASKNLLIMDIKDFRNVAIYGAFAAVGGLSAYMMWKRDISPLLLARKKRKWDEHIEKVRESKPTVPDRCPHGVWHGERCFECERI